MAVNPIAVAEATQIGEAQAEEDSSVAAIVAVEAKTDHNREKSNASNAKKQVIMPISAHEMPMLKNKSIHHQIIISESNSHKIDIKIIKMKNINNQGEPAQMTQIKFKTPLFSNCFQNQQMIKFI